MHAQGPVNCEFGRLPGNSGEKAGDHKDTHMRNTPDLVNCDRKIAKSDSTVERIQTNPGNHKNTHMGKDNGRTRPG